MTATIHEEPRLVDRRLSQYFNSTRAQWIDVVKAVVAARGGCGDNDSKSAGGYQAWNAGVRRMREIFRREGWEKGDEKGIETIVHRELKKKITVMNTDAGTCDSTRSPRNRTVKGSMGGEVTDLNNQIEMFKRREVGAPPRDQIAMWQLCVFDDGKIVRAELSRPAEFKAGYFVKFSERIFILRAGDWEKVAIMAPRETRDSGLQIDVRRKRK